MNFKNISIGALQVEPEWQKAFRAQVGIDYEDQAVKAGAQFAKEYSEILARTNPG